MAPVNRKEISLYEEAKSGFTSLIQQTAIIFAGFILMLLVTAGTPSSFVVVLSLCIGISFVAWSEGQRIKILRVNNTSFEENFILELQEEIASSSNVVEWNILKWFDEKFVPETARQIGGWSLLETDARPSETFSLKEWLVELIPLPGFSTQQTMRKHLILEKNLKILGESYILRISYVARKQWRFDLETPIPGMYIPKNFKLYIVKISGKKSICKSSKYSIGQERLSVKISIAKGDEIIVDIKPNPENYIYQILKF
ncbi:MAG: hypothetical protein QNJ47_13420 [Nostocaceae cyanobacterium]|nr:hypothetical protein [Nostocaceae cyanobacterium]